ncbi:tRNA A64-2'-O-ribosylphosphate transferase isoform X2 [Telopea speciosissima]|nr:tRNA A64-2'-O-ribosylphosphate transferase isoform X2 [Telopea speciosissima]
MAKTIPIWICVLNRAIANYIRETQGKDENAQRLETTSRVCETGSTEHVPCDWDCSLHLPLWVSGTEKAAIEDRLEDWTRQLEASGADIGSLASLLRKPLRPLWISQKTVIWLNEVPDCDSWGFTPIILVSASSSNGIIQQRNTSEYSWQYIPGAGDDEESWARGLSSNLFWKHVYDLLNSGPDLCNQKVADIVEHDRVYRAQRGEIAPQVTIKSQKLQTSNGHISDEDSSVNSGISNYQIDVSSSEESSIYWLGSTNLAVAATQFAASVSNVDCILNCDIELLPLSLNADTYLHLPVVGSKFDRFSLLRNLPSALKFAKLNLSKGRTLLVCCCNGEDISICVCLAILISLFDDRGEFLYYAYTIKWCNV